jgi:hypothetical protein
MITTIQLVRLIRSRPAEVVQNRLLRATDHALALVLTYLATADQNLVLAAVGPAKASRLTAEIDRFQHLRYSQAAFDQALSHVHSALQTDAKVASPKQWFRPVR